MKKKVFTIATIVMFCTLSLSAKHFLKFNPPTPKKNTNIKVVYSFNELQKNLQYDFARSDVRKAYYMRLDQLADLIIDKKYAVALRGYADSVGTYKGNWVLSQKRADAVKSYLVSKGVPDNLIVSTAFGSTQPLASNKSAKGRAQNRRVEVKLKGLND